MGIAPLLIEFTRRKRMHDLPNIRSVHTDPVPRLGGIAIFVATILVTLFVIFQQHLVSAAFREASFKIAVLTFSRFFA